MTFWMRAIHFYLCRSSFANNEEFFTYRKVFYIFWFHARPGFWPFELVTFIAHCKACTVRFTIVVLLSKSRRRLPPDLLISERFQLISSNLQNPLFWGVLWSQFYFAIFARFSGWGYLRYEKIFCIFANGILITICAHEL